MQNIDYQSFVNYAKMRYMAIADGFADGILTCCHGNVSSYSSFGSKVI